MYKLLLCVRMLRQRRITWLCVAGVALGLGTLIVVHSVMSGFADAVRSRIRGTMADMSLYRGESGFEPVLRVPRGDGEDGFDTKDVLEVVRAVPGVAAASPVLEGLAIIRLSDDELGRDFTRWCYFWGIDPAAEARVTRFAEWLNDGRGANPVAVFAPRGAADEIPIVLGRELVTARIRSRGGAVREKRLRLPGDTVVLTTVAFHGAVDARSSYEQFTVADTWKSGMFELDSQMTFVPLWAAQQLRRMPGRVTRIHVRLDDYRQAEVMRQRILEAVHTAGFEPFIIYTWEEERSTLLAAVAMELNLLVILLFFIIVVAGFGIVAILRMIVTEKVRDIGVVRALGGSRRGVAGIFLGFGLAIGVVGCVLGIAAGLLFTRYINPIEDAVASVTGRRVFSREIYYFDEIPTVISPTAILSFSVGVLVLCLLYSAWPAWRASRLDPVEAIRYE